MALVVAIACVVGPSSASAFSKAIWGSPYWQGVDQFPMYKKLGVSIYETDLYWSQVAPTRPRHPTNPHDPAYQWPKQIQQAVTLAKRFHISVLLEVITTPSWANGGRAENWAPGHPSDYAAFVSAAAHRYPSVHLWMIWGEPNRHGNFEPITPATPGARLNAAQQTAPHLYARILDAAYGALKSASSANIVIGGCTYTTGDIDTEQWIQNLRLPNGRAPRMDMYAHNPFSWTPPNFSDPTGGGVVQFSDLPGLARWIDRYLHRGIPIFLSEYTIPTAPDEEFSFYVAPQTAAQWVTDALRLARHWKRIYGLGWIHVYDQPPAVYGGLLTVSGVPKPTFAAFEHG